MNEQELRDVLRDRLGHAPDVDAAWLEVQQRVDGSPSTRPTAFPARSRSASTGSRVVAGVVALLVFALASILMIPMLRSPHVETAPSASVPFVPGAPKADALAAAQRLVALTQVPPGSEAHSHSPVRALRVAPGGYIACATDPCPYAIDIPAWWSMPLSGDQAILWLQAHPPAGLLLNGDTASSSGKVASVSWTYQDGPAPAYTRAELTLAVVGVAPDRSVLRVDGQVLWVPPRSAAEHVPDNVDQVRLEAYQGDRIVTRKVFHGGEARELAGLLNHLGRINMGSPRCPFNAPKAVHYTMTFQGLNGSSLVFTEWPSCSGGPTVFVEVGGHSQPALSDQTQTLSGSSVVSSDFVQAFLKCRLSDPYPGCRSLGIPSSGPPPDPEEGFCSGLHQLRDWFSTDVADANGDETALAGAVQGELSGVMMWFQPNEQAITDPEVRAAADGIITDALALQTWTPGAGTSFTQRLNTFNADSGSFVSDHC